MKLSLPLYPPATKPSWSLSPCPCVCVSFITSAHFVYASVPISHCQGIVRYPGGGERCCTRRAPGRLPVSDRNPTSVATCSVFPCPWIRSSWFVLLWLALYSRGSPSPLGLRSTSSEVDDSFSEVKLQNVRTLVVPPLVLMLHKILFDSGMLFLSLPSEQHTPSGIGLLRQW